MSACIPTDRLLQTLRAQVPGVTDEMLNLQVFNVVDEFLRRTNAWVERNEITLEEDVVEYPLNLPEGSTLVRMMAVSHNDVPVPSSSSGGIVQQSLGRLVPELTFPDGDASFAPAQSDLAAGLFTYAIYEPGYIQTTNPDAEAVKFPLNVHVALSVSHGCLECDCGDWNVPEWMWDMYFQAWLDGVLGRLYAMPAKPWSSKVEASYHHKRFRNAMAFHKHEVLSGLVFNSPTWRFPRGDWV